uniref:Cytochrome b2 n=1 Tax=Moniliophthora roreri TaxID=221103 RepID=A0A0W0FBI3_MONRR
MPYTLEEVAEHNKPHSCWVIINEQVYDVTDFLLEHPGGASIILKYAGRDATRAYEPIHPKDALEKNLPASKHLGPIHSDAAKKLAEADAKRKKTKDELRVELAMRQRPLLSRVLSLADMEAVAYKVLPYKVYRFYSTGADDEVTLDQNSRAFTRFFFHARVMRPVSNCDLSTTILGFKSSLPIFVCGAALAKLGHPLGEVNITRACGKAGLIQMISTHCSCSYSEIADAALPAQPLFFQLYKSSNDKKAEILIREVERLGYKSIWLTVDLADLGNRERDVRSVWELEEQETGPVAHNEELSNKEAVNFFGTSNPVVAQDDRDMTFEKTIPWLRSITKLPIVLKGVQCVEDAILAAEAGVDGILLSNHGGRQLEYSLPPMEVLYKIRKQQPDVFHKTEVFLDGGVRRGTGKSRFRYNVIKALCLGARAVGFGRAFLYAQSAYGEAGCDKIIQILDREMTTAMRLLGASRIQDLKPEMVERVDWEPIIRSRL